MSNIQLATTDPEYRQWIGNIKKRFHQQQIKAAVQVNSSKIEFYWSLGRDICEFHDRQEKSIFPAENQFVPQVVEILTTNNCSIPWRHHNIPRAERLIHTDKSHTERGAERCPSFVESHL